MEKETKVLSFATQKGGSGKSTLTHMIALALMGKGYKKKVLVIDADEQKNLTNAYARQQKQNNASPETAIKTYDLISCPLSEIRNTLKANFGNYDDIFIDLPGTFMASGVKTALLYCDYVFVPIKHSQPDIDSSKEVFKILEEIKKARKERGEDFDFYSLISIAEPEKLNYKTFSKHINSQSYKCLKNPFNKYVKYENALTSFNNILDAPKWKHEEEAFNRLFQEFYKLTK
jgi:chromosome partitioning protein